MIAHESGVAEVADPLGGAWVIEAWTDEIVRRARDYVEKIDWLGGARAAVEKGFQQREIADAAYAYQRALEEGRTQGGGDQRLRRRRGDAHRGAGDRPRPRRPTRSAGSRPCAPAATPAAPPAALADLSAAAGEDRNLMPPILACVRAEVTLGEISHALRRVYGEYRDSVPGDQADARALSSPAFASPADLSARAGPARA